MADKRYKMDDEGEAARLENLCRRCGVCCHQKVRFGDVVVITDVPCEFLDPATLLCRVYPERFSHQPLCSTAETSAGLGALPGDCPYVGGLSDYAAPVLLRDHPEYESAVNTIFPERVVPPSAKVNLKALRYGRGKRRP